MNRHNMYKIDTSDYTVLHCEVLYRHSDITLDAVVKTRVYLYSINGECKISSKLFRLDTIGRLKTIL